MTVIKGSRMRITKLDPEGRVIKEPEDLLGARVSLSFDVETTGFSGELWRILTGAPGRGPEPEEVDLLWVEDQCGVWSPGAGASAVRALAIVTGLEGLQVREMLQAEMDRRWSEARGADRVYKSVVERYSGSVWERVPREVMDQVMGSLGWVWVPVMSVGSVPVGRGRMRVRWSELPEEALADRVVLRLSSNEYVAVVNGVLRCPEDPSRGGGRMVYGYYCRAEVREVFAQPGERA